VHDGLTREAEARARRLEAIATERRNWLSRAENASQQIASLAERKAEAEEERERLAEAPDEIDARRRALLSQLSQAEDLRKAAGDRLQEAENLQGGLDKAATAAIQGLAEAREARARRRERLTAADERRQEWMPHPRGAEHAAAPRIPHRLEPTRRARRREVELHSSGSDRARAAGRGQSARRGGAEGAVRPSGSIVSDARTSSERSASCGRPSRA